MRVWGLRPAPWTSTPKVTLRPWVALSMPPVLFQLAAHLRAPRCLLGQEGPHWMALTPRPWGSRAGDPPRSTRTSCTSCGRRSWPTRCWPGGSPCLTTCRWPCRESARCPGCSSRCPRYLRPLCLPQGLAPALALALALARDQHHRITAGLTVWEGPTCLPQDPQACPPGCLASPPEGLPSPGLKDPWQMLPPPRAPPRSWYPHSRRAAPRPPLPPSRPPPRL